jgi:hypothetical protein
MSGTMLYTQEEVDALVSEAREMGRKIGREVVLSFRAKGVDPGPEIERDSCETISEYMSRMRALIAKNYAEAEAIEIETQFVQWTHERDTMMGSTTCRCWWSSLS